MGRPKMRFVLGLKTSLPGYHTPGIGLDAVPYRYPAEIRRTQLPFSDDLMMEGSCPLLRATVPAVRGLLALARKEAEAGW